MGATKLRILTYPWHIGHQYELFKLPHDFLLFRGENGDFRWNEELRPLPRSAAFVQVLRRQDYDLAILPFDEHVLTPMEGLSPLTPSWGRTFARLLDWCRQGDLPVIALCHGTVPRRGRFEPGYAQDPEKPDEPVANRIRDLLRGIPVVCNAREALEEWGFEGRAIIHGFDPDEYPLGGRRGGILTIASNVYSNCFYQGFDLFEQCARRLPIDLLGSDANFDRLEKPLSFRPIAVRDPRFGRAPGRGLRRFEWGRRLWARRKFENYKTLIGEHAIYLNPTRFSPMPRARVEAMLCGLAVVSTPYYDFARYVVHGETGFVFETAGEAIDILSRLQSSPGLSRDVGGRGRQAAVDLFHIDRYLREWQETIDRCLSRRPVGVR